MVTLSTEAEVSIREAVTLLEMKDMNGDGKDEVIVTTVAGDVRVIALEPGPGAFRELAVMRDLPPSSAMSIGDVVGDGRPDIVLGGLDDTLRVITLGKGGLKLRTVCPLGTLPTSVCATNVQGDQRAEVIVGSNDKALRCYGWFDTALDKLAHKVVEQPAFSVQPLFSQGVPYTRVVYGDESRHIYVYQYADDRLHEAMRAETRGPVSLVATGRIAGKRNDDIVTVSDGRQIGLFSVDQGTIKPLDNIRAPGVVTSVRVGSLYDQGSQQQQIVVCEGNSHLAVMALEGRRLNPVGSLKTERKAAEARIAVGNPMGEGTRIVQAVGNSFYVIAVQT
ncbi:MAG: VCBS repeat-containing protein [Candidatus Thorarchaeota archaeon]|nr:VCBS repeat-containing protein [Candidatus Thorarchaeota archaeon]